MDTLRNDDDREINHHGKSIKINGDDDNEEIIKVFFLAPVRMLNIL